MSDDSGLFSRPMNFREVPTVRDRGFPTINKVVACALHAFPPHPPLTTQKAPIVHGRHDDVTASMMLLDVNEGRLDCQRLSEHSSSATLRMSSTKHQLAGIRSPLISARFPHSFSQLNCGLKLLDHPRRAKNLLGGAFCRDSCHPRTLTSVKTIFERMRHPRRSTESRSTTKMTWNILYRSIGKNPQLCQAPNLEKFFRSHSFRDHERAVA